MIRTSNDGKLVQDFHLDFDKRKENKKHVYTLPEVQ